MHGTSPNLATDEETLIAFKRVVPSSRLMDIRRDRQTLHEQWLRYHNIWGAKRDQQSYHGRSKSYLPIGRKIIENWVSKLKRDLFSADPFFAVAPRRQAFEEQAEATKSLFDYFLKKHMRVRRKSGPFLRQLVMYGTSPVHIGWQLSERDLPTLQREADDRGVMRTKATKSRVFDYIGPTFRVVDLFSWYVYPTTCLDVADAELAFEDRFMTVDALRRMTTTPIDAKRPSLGMIVDPDAFDVLLRRRQGLASSDADREKVEAEMRRLQRRGLTHPLNSLQNPHRPVDVTLLYIMASLDDEAPEWWEVMLANDAIPLRIRKNPWWHGRPPWLAPKFVELTDEFYGYGLPSVFDRLQYWLVDVMDQAADGLTYSMNPIAVIDQFRVQDPSSIRFRAGAKWLADPEGVKFAEPPKETPAIGMQAIQFGTALMNDVSNVSSVGGVGSRGPRNRGRGLDTATGVSIAATEALLEIRDVTENIEDGLWNPLLYMMHTSVQQCMQDRSVILRIQGGEGVVLVEKRVSAIDVVGDLEFNWLGSLHTANREVRASQMVNFLSVVSQIPPELFAAQNAQIDFKFLLRAIWGVGFGLPDPNRVVQDKTKMRSVDPTIENDLFQVGRGAEVDVAPGDDHRRHAQVHLQLVEDPRTPADVKEVIFLHIREHASAHIAMQLMQQQQEQQQQQQQLLGGPQSSNGRNQQQYPSAAPQPPGRLAQTSGIDDVMRQAPRGMT